MFIRVWVTRVCDRKLIWFENQSTLQVDSRTKTFFNKINFRLVKDYLLQTPVTQTRKIVKLLSIQNWFHQKFGSTV